MEHSQYCELEGPGPVESAREAHLHYLHGDEPGIQRLRRGSGFAYQEPGGAIVRDPAALSRIRALAIPPAWTDVWIAADPRGHLQATGRDARGRKQYRYHPRWRTVRDESKYRRLLAFGQALPAIRRRIDRDLALRGLPRQKVVAAVVRLLDLALARIGNDAYARENQSFGLTTLQNRHVRVEGTAIRLQFRGKAGRFQSVAVSDRRLSRVVRRCRELPGQQLFQYEADSGGLERIASDDVNDYLRSVSGQDFTAKDFRTWAGTVFAAAELRAIGPFDSERQATHNVSQAIQRVASRLGNTPAICRKCYVHPAVLEAYRDGGLLAESGLQDAQSRNAELATLRILRRYERPAATSRRRRADATASAAQ